MAALPNGEEEGGSMGGKNNPVEKVNTRRDNGGFYWCVIPLVERNCDQKDPLYHPPRALTTGPFLIHASAAPFNCTNMTNALLPSRQNQKIYHKWRYPLNDGEKKTERGIDLLERIQSFSILWKKKFINLTINLRKKILIELNCLYLFIFNLQCNLIVYQ